MRKMAREFTDGMNQIANDAEVAELKKAVNEAKGGDMDKLASAIDPGGGVGESMRDLNDSMDKDSAADDIKEIGNMAGKAGQDIADDAKADEPAGPTDTDAGNDAAVKKS